VSVAVNRTTTGFVRLIRSVIAWSIVEGSVAPAPIPQPISAVERTPIAAGIHPRHAIRFVALFISPFSRKLTPAIRSFSDRFLF